MSTPTVGSLRRRIERLEQEQRQDTPEMVSDDGEVHEAADSIDLVSMPIEEFAARKVRIADLEARVEELEAETGLLDGESERRGEVYFKESEKCTRLRSVGDSLDLQVYVDSKGFYWVTGSEILHEGAKGLAIRHPAQLRELADQIEEAER